jgi:group I intron endonuclease
MKLEVYKVTNKQNGKIYIGITNQGVTVRWSKHCSDARRNSTFLLSKAIRKYGEQNFLIETI